MVKKTGIIAALSCAFAICLALVGCGAGDGGDSSKDALVGTWNLVSMTRDGSVTDEADIKALADLGLEVNVEVNEDGTLALTLFGEPTNGTWEASGDLEGTIKMEDSEMTYSLEDEKLTIVDNESSMTFEKAKESDDSSDAAESGESEEPEESEESGEASEK